MIPRTFPSIPDNQGEGQMVVYPLSSIAGLQAWLDYIPVRNTTENTAVENTYANNGYIKVTGLSSISGLVAFKDYIPVYEDQAFTRSWSTDAGGFIPVFGLYISGAFLDQENGFTLLTEAGDNLITE